MTTFEIPTVVTAQLKLRAFEAGDLDAYAEMRANPEVVRYLAADGRRPGSKSGACITAQDEPAAA